MEYIRNFLESSTIHGLSYISTTKKYVRLFWILVVTGGFTGAGVLIYTSFQSWADSPVKTTIETLPITEITFPKVTVCPPKNTYTDLNYDFMMTKNMTLDNDTKNELTQYAAELLYDNLHDTMIANLSKLEDNDRYYNWYHGYTQILVPSIDDFYGVHYKVLTAATFGTIATKHFGDKFDAEKVEGKICYEIHILPPDSVKNNSNVTLHLNIEKMAMKDLDTTSYESGFDNLIVERTGVVARTFVTDDGYNYTAPTGDSDFYIKLRRNVVPADIMKQKLKMMPGFKLKWHYSGLEVNPVATYENKAFIRKCSNFVPKFPLRNLLFF